MKLSVMWTPAWKERECNNGVGGCQVTRIPVQMKIDFLENSSPGEIN